MNQSFYYLPLAILYSIIIQKTESIFEPLLKTERKNAMGMMQDFKAFAVRGNVVDMAVGVIVGAAFGKIVSSFVADVVMPPIGVLLGGVNFSDLAVTIKEAADKSPAVIIAYGKFAQTVIDFTIIAFVIFMAVRFITSLKKKEEAAPAAPAAPSAEEVLLTEIRDLLKK
ncbi:large-conductance mechanosensitive channel protein MscL [Sulfuricella denitrificans]